MRAQYTIKKVILRNFISHRETIIDFDQGVTVLIGPNGAGKTSILEAIYFALTGKGWRAQRRKKDLINTGAREAIVEMTMGIGDDEELYIKRKIPGTPTDTILQLRVSGKTVDTARGEAQVNEKIKEILGLDPERLRTIAIIPQGGITRLFTDLTPSERKKIIDSLLGIDDYEKAYQNIAELDLKAPEPLASMGIITVTPRQSMIKNLERYLVETMPRETRETKQQLDRLAREKSNAEKEIEKIEEESRKINKELEKLEEEIKEIEEARIKYEKLETIIERLSREIGELSDRIKEQEEKISTIEEKLAHMKLIEKILEMEKEYSEYKHKKKRLEELIKRNKEIEEEIKRLGPIKEKLEQLASRIKKPLEQLEKEAEVHQNTIKEKQEQLEKLAGELEALKHEEAGLAKELENLESEIKEFLRKTVSLLEIKETDPMRVPDIVLEKTMELIEEHGKVNKELKTIEKRIGELEALKKQEMEKLEILIGTGEGKCPLCGQPLTEERRAEMIKKTRKKIKHLGSELDELVNIKKKLEDRLKTLENLVDQARNLAALAERVKFFLEKRAVLEPKLRELRRTIDEKIRVKEEIEKEIKDLEVSLEEISNMINDAKLYNDLLKLSSPEKLGILKEEKERIGDEITMLNKWINGFEDKMKELTGGKDVDYEEVFVKARAAYDKLVMLAGQKKELEKTLDKIREEKKTKEEELEKLVSELEKLKDKIEELERAKKKKEELKERKEELLRREAELRARIESLNERIEELGEKLEEIRSREKAVREILYKLKILQWIRDNILHRDKAPALLRRRYMRLIEALMRDYIRVFELGYNDVSIDDDFNIYLKAPGSRTPIEIGRLSGGEKVVVSLVAMLALHKVVGSDRLGFLILDEPTEFLDDERRRKLIELLKKFGGGKIIKQLIIVTHDEEIKEAAETLYRVAKTNGYSQVERIEIGG